MKDQDSTLTMEHIYNHCHIKFKYKVRIMTLTLTVFKISKKEGKDQYSIQSSTIPDPGYQWESDNVTIRHHKREPRGQSFPSSQHTDVHERIINKT